MEQDQIKKYQEQTKKYSEMTYEEFLTEVLGIKLEQWQLHMIKMFEENKTKKVEYAGNWYPSKRDGIDLTPWTVKTTDSKPTVTYCDTNVAYQYDLNK